MRLLTKLGLVTLTLAAGAVLAAPLDSADPQLTTAIHEGESTRALMVEDANHVQHLQAIARREKDAIKLNCVNDKLVQLRPRLNVADRAQLELNGGNVASLETIKAEGEAVRKLREEADQCIGEPVLGDESSNTFTHPPIVDVQDTDGFGDVFEPPTYASPMD